MNFLGIPLGLLSGAFCISKTIITDTGHLRKSITKQTRKYDMHSDIVGQGLSGQLHHMRPKENQLIIKSRKLILLHNIALLYTWSETNFTYQHIHNKTIH